MSVAVLVIAMGFSVQTTEMGFYSVPVILLVFGSVLMSECLGLGASFNTVSLRASQEKARKCETMVSIRFMSAERSNKPTSRVGSVLADEG
jgi:hypothetical protein